MIPDLDIYRSANRRHARAEFKAIIEALRWLGPEAPAIIFSDSLLAVNVLNGKWRGKKNRDLVNTGRDLLAKRSVELQ